jgi:hypothetical protein
MTDAAKADCLRRATREIERSAGFCCRASVIDSDHDGPARRHVSNLHARPHGQTAVRSGESAWAKPLATCRMRAELLAAAIPTRQCEAMPAMTMLPRFCARRPNANNHCCRYYHCRYFQHFTFGWINPDRQITRRCFETRS